MARDTPSFNGFVPITRPLTVDCSFFPGLASGELALGSHRWNFAFNEAKEELSSPIKRLVKVQKFAHPSNWN